MLKHNAKRSSRQSPETGPKQTQEVLQRYELLSRHSRDIMLFIRRRDGRILEANEAALQAYGYTRAELLALFIHQLRAPAVRSLTEQQMEAADAGGLLFETEHRRKDGTIFPVEVSSRGTTIGAERVLLSIIRDITERKRSQEALRESEVQVRRKLKSILSPEGGVGDLELGDLIDVPAIQSLMDHFYELVRIPMAVIDLKGKVLVGVGWQAICTRFHRVHPETGKHCIESDTQLTAGVTPGEFRLYRCKNHMWDIATPILVGDQHLGNVFSGQFFFENEALDYQLFRAQARRYGFDEAAYLDALQAVPRLSRETVNKAMAFFIQLAQMLSQSSYDNVRLARLLAERDALATSLRQSEQQLQAHAEELEQTVAQRTARLQEAVTELEHFSYAITHDMRAPLRAIQGFASVIQEGCAGCDRASLELYQRIQRASSRMDQLITDSLNYSKAVRQELPLAPVNLLALLQGLVETYPNLQPDQADIAIAPDLPPVLGNEAALTQCFSNLLGNAVKFAKPGQRPQIRIWAEGGGEAERRGDGETESGRDGETESGRRERVRIWVEDNGIGIPKAFQKRLFDMFQRAAKDREGTGIGLAIVRKIVQRLGGEIGVESEQDHGSRFWIKLKLPPP